MALVTRQGSDAQEQLAVDLWEAVRDGDARKSKSLLGQGANPNHQLYWTEDWFWKKRRIPPLHEACKNGYLEITIALVSCEADIEVGDGRGETAFHWACRGGHKEILVYLSQDEKCRVDMTDIRGKTPLDVAVEYGHTEVVDYLKSLRKPSTSELVNIQNRSYLQKLDELMADRTNTVELHYLKMHFIGPTGVGKTTTRQRLVGSITNLSFEDQRKRCATLLAEYEQVLAFVDKSGTKLEFKATANLEEETQSIFSYLMSCEPIEDSTVSNVSPPEKQALKETTDLEKLPLKSSYCSKNGLTKSRECDCCRSWKGYLETPEYCGFRRVH